VVSPPFKGVFHGVVRRQSTVAVILISQPSFARQFEEAIELGKLRTTVLVFQKSNLRELLFIYLPKLLSDIVQPCTLSMSMSTPIDDVVPFSWYDGSWKYATNSGGGDSVVPWLPGTPWQAFMYLRSSILHRFNRHTSSAISHKSLTAP
jgi:hypothetical protein